MDTGKIRNFAVTARERLIAGVDERLNSLGFAADGSVPEENRPVRIEGGAKFLGEVLSDTSFFDKWTKLASDIRHRGRKEVRDAAAYTWFNRFCAIRIMAKRGFIPPVLEYVGNKDARTPALVASMRAGEPQKLRSDERNRLDRIRFDDAKTIEQFSILVMALCRNNDIIRICFGAVLDYTDLLLPRDILTPGGFVDALNDPEVISDEDYRKDELIGWLYQYYISARKQEVFDSFKEGKKAEAEDIPAATEIFTPNWIVKYMVENSLGRLAIENGLGGDFTDDWQYLIREEKDSQSQHLKIDSPEELTFADLACGSGHILLEGFRHLMEIYAEAGYSRRQAVECIFRKNLLGIDLDARARQLSQFALLLAAMSEDSSFADAHVMPRVLDMEDTLGEGEYSRVEIAELLSVQEDAVLNELCEAFALLVEAHNLGSTMKFDVSERTRGILAVKVSELEREVENNAVSDELFSLSVKYLPSFRLILALTERYMAISMNPPYMGAGNMNGALADYVKREYPGAKADLFSVFMEVSIARCAVNGYVGMITMQSWMFLSSFETLRKWLLGNCTILSMAHLGAHAFGSIGGEVTQTTVFALANEFTPGYKGKYYRLVGGRSEDDKKEMYSKATPFTASAENFAKIPGSPIAYWVGDKMLKSFENAPISEYGFAGIGMRTGDNKRFLRIWHEVSIAKVLLGCSAKREQIESGSRWIPYNKGGEFRKWYGNNDYLIDWLNDGFAIKTATLENYPQLDWDHLGWKISNESYYYIPGITWSGVTSGDFACRCYGAGFIFDSGANGFFPNSTKDIPYFAGLLNSCFVNTVLKVINPTINTGCGTLNTVPVIVDTNIKSAVEQNVTELISLSRSDWDAYETSWDFKVNPLVVNSRGRTLEETCRALAKTWRTKTLRMKELEEENNRLFIEAYGLQGELSPDVPMHQVSLKCNPYYRYGVVKEEGETLASVTALEGKIEDGALTIEKNDTRQRKDTIRELISYAVGCLMGRYSLEKEGLILASQGETLEDYRKKIGEDAASASHPDGSRLVPDDDGILPVVAGETSFTDNAPQRVVDFVKVVFGEERLTKNLNFIEATLGKTLEAYLAKDFWNDHRRTYKNRPIYWLFRSKKGAFQALVYMHRMDAYTATKVRNGYLLPHIEFLHGRIAAESARGADLTAKERTRLKKMQQAIEECLEYDGRLHVVADRMQAIDLDDGVAVNYAKFGDVLAKLK